MSFDIEIAVRLVWAGIPIVNVPTGVRYLSRAAGGTSHFRPVRDNVAITLMHTRLLFASLRWHLGFDPEAHGVTAPPAAAATSWLRTTERGSALGLRLLIGICRLLGRGFTRLLLAPIVFYFVVLAPQARRASRDYLRRVGQPHGFRAVYAHFLRFAHVTLDRLFFVLGKHRAFTITRTGKEHLVGAEAAAARRAAARRAPGQLRGDARAWRPTTRCPSTSSATSRTPRLINGVLREAEPGPRRPRHQRGAEHGLRARR